MTNAAGQAVIAGRIKSAPGGVGSTARGLTRSSDLTREGLGMKPTRKRNIVPEPTVPTGLSDVLCATYTSWPERFRSKVEIGTGCWEWQACRVAKGYGRYSRSGSGSDIVYAHRFVFELATGSQPPPSSHVDHLCRNTACVRPDHLELVTPAENATRGALSNEPAGTCRSGRHPWVAENIYTRATGVRVCRPCNLEMQRRSRDKRRAKETRA